MLIQATNCNYFTRRYARKKEIHCNFFVTSILVCHSQLKRLKDLELPSSSKDRMAANVGGEGREDSKLGRIESIASGLQVVCRQKNHKERNRNARGMVKRRRKRRRIRRIVWSGTDESGIPVVGRSSIHAAASVSLCVALKIEAMVGGRERASPVHRQKLLSVFARTSRTSATCSSLSRESCFLRRSLTGNITPWPSRVLWWISGYNRRVKRKIRAQCRRWWNIFLLALGNETVRGRS